MDRSNRNFYNASIAKSELFQPPSFTLRQLQCFVAACEQGGVSVAAARLYLAPSTVSAAIADLEQALGVQLLVRAPRRAATPSPAGRELLRAARDALAAAERVTATSAALRGDVIGELPVGCLVTVAPVVAPPVFAAFERRWPRARAQLEPGDQSSLLGWLRDAKIDVAITYDLGLEDGIDFEPLAARPPYALVPRGHRLAGRTHLTIDELASEPLVLLDLPLSREYFLDLFRAAGVKPVIGRRAADPELARSLVAHGYGYTLGNLRPAPKQSVDGTALAAIPLAGPMRGPHIGLATLHGVTPTRIAEAFAEVCSEVLKP